MKKRLLFVVIGLLLLIAILAGIKFLQINTMITQGKEHVPPPEIVTAASARSESWATSLSAVGTLTAVQGVTVAAELPGKVAAIAFTPGAPVAKGALLLRQDTVSEQAQLPGAIAQTKLAKAELDRARQLLEGKIISPSDYDKAFASWQLAVAQENITRAAIAKKTIHAPFSGRLGIRQVHLGQILREGDPVVTLQSLNPLYVDFSLPQQQAARLRNGLPVQVVCDALPGVTVKGRITTINPLVDAETRNLKLQATVDNSREQLRPGMFVTVSVVLPVQEQVLAIPATSVLYAPYGDSVFVIDNDKHAQGGKVLRQQFVRLGSKRGDFIAVTSGLKAGDQVVSTGVFKLRNGQKVAIDNKLAPQFLQAPQPENN